MSRKHIGVFLCLFGFFVMFIKLSQSCINHHSVGFVLYAVQEHVFYSWIHNKLYFRYIFRHNQFKNLVKLIHFRSRVLYTISRTLSYFTLYYIRIHPRSLPQNNNIFCVRKSALNDFVCEFAFPYR